MGDLPNEQFGKIELAIRYSDDIESFGINDPSILAFVGWLKNGGLDQNWKLKNVICNNCSGTALELKGDRKLACYLPSLPQGHVEHNNGSNRKSIQQSLIAVY